MSTQPTHHDTDLDPRVDTSGVWEPPPTEPVLFASFFQDYDGPRANTCIVYDSDTRSGDAWVESSIAYERIPFR